jgi:hypothetical protein
METEQLQNFNERLSQWVANQGFWFQVRYSMSGTGVRGRAMFHLLRMGFRLLVFLVVVAIGVWIYLVKRPDSAVFQERFREQIKQALGAEDLDMGLDRQQGQLEINRLGAESGNGSFFSAMEARNIRCKMSLVDGLLGVWDPGVISIARLDMDLRAGTDDAESAARLSEVVFRRSEKVKINAFEVAEASLRWGFSERAQGSIEGSLMRAQRVDSGWRLTFRDGEFSQNWLKNLQIVEMIVLCEPSGLLFEKAVFRQKEGSVDFGGLRVISGERPTLSGVVKIRNLNLDGILPLSARSFVEGSISGDFKVSGSTNSAEGVGLEGQVVMDGKDVVSVRERIRLLEALSVVDFSRNYHRVDFREGSFQIKTGGGGMLLSDIKLKAEDQFTMEGNIRVRLPTDQEVQAALDQGETGASSPIFRAEDDAAERGDLKRSESDFTLKRAAIEARRVAEGQQSADSLDLFKSLGLSIEMRQLKAQAAERMSRMLRYEGAVVITIPGDAFERASRLQALYPVDRSTGRIAMRVPIEGSIYEITLKQAEDVYLQGQR